MKISINKVHYPVTTLGYGRRVVLWVQGCTIRCPGCINKDTWLFHPDRWIDVETITLALSEWINSADGLTISGGEPFDQPASLLELLRNVRPMVLGDILLFSGYSRCHIEYHYPDILEFIDVLIDGPFRPDAGQTRVLRGSDNQTINILTKIGWSRYAFDINRLQGQNSCRMDIIMDENTLWMAGIPQLGFMSNFREELSQRGFTSTTSDQIHALVRA